MPVRRTLCWVLLALDGIAVSDRHDVSCEVGMGGGGGGE